jgi:gamma-glutamyl:cysteine ligase YbdK (ATP-grasp superfamily)
LNAYELADKLMSSLTMEYDCDEYMKQSATMLRHQADYISQLEKGLESSIAMNKAQAERQVKELTDEEIQEIAHSFGAIGWMGDTTYEFARAILRKAQEK